MDQAAAFDAYYNYGPPEQQTSPTGGASESTAVQDGDATSSNTAGKVEEAGRET